MDSSIEDLPARGEQVWFLILGEGHQGPYSFEELLQQATPDGHMIWAKTWPVPLPFGSIRAAYLIKEAPSSFFEDPLASSVEARSHRKHWMIFIGGLLFLVLGVQLLMEGGPELTRPSGMSRHAFKSLADAFPLLRRSVPISLLAVREDYKKIWLADRSSQECLFLASFHSSSKDNLSGKEVTFHSEAISKNHWVEWDKYDFTANERPWPGIYQVKIQREDCRATGLARLWQTQDSPLELSFSAAIFSGMRADLDARLEKLHKEAEALENRAQRASDYAWRDVEEKFRTLMAISLQIQQDFQPMLNNKVPWKTRVKNTVERYTLRYGGFLTNFTIRNDEDFRHLAAEPLEGKLKLMERQPVINEHAKRIGFISMGFIEWLQRGVPKRVDLEKTLGQLGADLATEREALEKEARAAQAVYASGKDSAPAP